VRESTRAANPIFEAERANRAHRQRPGTLQTGVLPAPPARSAERRQRRASRFPALGALQARPSVVLAAAGGPVTRTACASRLQPRAANRRPSNTRRHVVPHHGNGMRSDSGLPREAQCAPVRHPGALSARRVTRTAWASSGGHERQTTSAPSPRGAPELRLLFPCGCRDSGACGTTTKPAKSFVLSMSAPGHGIAHLAPLRWVVPGSEDATNMVG